MQYMVMICDDEKDQPEFGSAEFLKVMQGFADLEKEYEGTGKILGGGGRLDSISKAKTVRVRNGKTEVVDGPFAESREVIGGYMVLDCDTFDEALEIAAKIPCATWGSIEVRPFIQSQYESSN